MDMINHEEITDLLEQHEGIHISLFMPLNWEPENISANRIRLKNLIKQGRQQVADAGFLPPDLPQPDLEKLFQPAQDLLGNGRLSVEQGQSLAIFLAQEFYRIFGLPLPMPELVVIGPRFYIIPLLPFFSDNGRFYLLSLSQNQVKMWLGSPFNLEKMELPALPKGMEDALALEDPERSLQFHTSTESGQARPAAFHGHDSDKEKKGAILRYFRAVNKAVQEALTAMELPLLLASVAYLQPIYKEANSHSYLLPEGVSGNPDNLSTRELHKQAWQIIQQHFEQTKSTAWQRYLELAGTDKASQLLAEIVPAAAFGRVETLFVNTGVQIQGQFNPSSGELEICSADSFYCEDLINLAAISTLVNGGSVYMVQPEELPDEAQLSAIFRYAD